MEMLSIPAMSREEHDRADFLGKLIKRHGFRGASVYTTTCCLEILDAKEGPGYPFEFPYGYCTSC